MRCGLADRTLVLATNGRFSARGLTSIGPQEFAAYQDEDDNLTYVVDLSPYLEGATISSVTRTADGPTVSNTSATSTRITQRLKGFGYVDITATLSTGDVEQIRICIKPRANNSVRISNYI